MTAAAPARSAPLTGLGNQTRREAASWWTTGRWRRQALVWTTILAGLFVVMYWALPALLPEEAGLPTAELRQTAQQFTELAAIVTAIGVVLLTQGLILDERRNGVQHTIGHDRDPEGRHAKDHRAAGLHRHEDR